MFHHGDILLLPHARRIIQHCDRTRHGSSAFPFHLTQIPGDHGVTYRESKATNCHSYSYLFKQTGEVIIIKPSITLSMKLTDLYSSWIDLKLTEIAPRVCPWWSILFSRTDTFCPNPIPFRVDFVLHLSVILPTESSFQQQRSSLIHLYWSTTRQRQQENCCLCRGRCCFGNGLRHHAHPSGTPSGPWRCASHSLCPSPSPSTAEWPQAKDSSPKSL